MLDNMYTRDSPLKDDQVRKRDIHNNYIMDSITDEHVMIQKKLICVTPNELHKLMQKPRAVGGYENARDANGKLRFLVSTIIKYWPNWLIPIGSVRL